MLGQTVPLRTASFMQSPNFSAVKNALLIAPATTATGEQSWAQRNRGWLVFGIGAAVLLLSGYLLLSKPKPAYATANRRKLKRKQILAAKYRKYLEYVRQGGKGGVQGYRKALRKKLAAMPYKKLKLISRRETRIGAMARTELRNRGELAKANRRRRLTRGRR